MKKIIQPLVVGNWKMNPLTETMAVRLARDIKKGCARIQDVAVVIAPPSLYLGTVHKILDGSHQVQLGVQNVHWDKLGAHTGEISLPMLKNFAVSYVIIGHSERRELGETDVMVNTKIQAALKAGITPIVCVGEKMRDHSADYLGFVERQIREACKGVPRAKLSRIVIAYEPIWAIGTGNTATPADAHEMKLFIQRILTDLYGRAVAMKVKVLYGGSVNAKNAEILLSEGAIDGFLVGGASINADEFIQIIKIAAA